MMMTTWICMALINLLKWAKLTIVLPQLAVITSSSPGLNSGFASHTSWFHTCVEKPKTKRLVLDSSDCKQMEFSHPWWRSRPECVLSISVSPAQWAWGRVVREPGCRPLRIMIQHTDGSFSVTFKLHFHSSGSSILNCVCTLQSFQMCVLIFISLLLFVLKINTIVILITVQTWHSSVRVLLDLM